MSNNLSYFTKRYAFVDSVSITGRDYNYLNITPKSIVKNCNFNFDSDNVKIKSIDGMFSGCENAVFSNALRISANTVTSAVSAFSGCKNAKLPVVDIGESSIEDSRGMFEDCYSAELGGVEIPRLSRRFSRMFRNSKSAFFNEISEIPYGDGDYTELFCGCENGTFHNLHFTKPSEYDKLSCGKMFYYCGKMDCSELGLDRISENISDASYMFYSAGRNCSEMLDDSVFSFSSLENCEFMFSNSNFSFSNSFFRFDGNGEFYNGKISTASITSLSRVFSECGFCGERSPVVILGHPLNGLIDHTNADEYLNHRLYGHYGASLENSIIDFSRMYENSMFRTLDIRGISNNGVLNSNSYGAVQKFTSMCSGCTKMERILGYIPTNAESCESMFEGCSSLSADISKLFVSQSSSWNDMSELSTAFNRDSDMKSYSVKNISKMFKDCGYIYSTSDVVDIVGLFKRIENNVGGDVEKACEAVSGCFPPIRIATKNQIPLFRNVDYDIYEISSKTGTVRYNSFSDEPFEVSNGTNPTASKFGVYSNYAKSAFYGGFYRYGGKFTGSDKDKIFFIMYYPDVDDGEGKVVSFSAKEAKYSVELTPHGWGSVYNTEPSIGYWSEFSFDRLYAGIVCNLRGDFIKKAYIGNYTRTYHERRSSSAGSFDVVNRYDMPVTYFDGCEDLITLL